MSPGGTADRWHRVEELLGVALGRDASERDAFLDAACEGDANLRSEVDSLLAAHERFGVLDRLSADVAPLASRLRGEPTPSMAGRTIGRYQVLERVAGGGMGVVYKAVDERLARTVALKFLHPRFDTDDSAAERFRLEARAVAALEHPNICTVHEIGETDDGQLYLAMPLYDGETLQQRIGRGPLPVPEAVSIAVQIARGLAKAHARGIVHRDIKPSNVLVTRDGVVKVLDFGIAKLADVTLTGTAPGPLGTVAYMSPEQLRGERVDPRTDVWSLGVVLYEMLAGQRPFDGDAASAVSVSIQHAEPTSLTTHRSDVPAALDRVVTRSLAKSPDARYPSMQELERDLGARSAPDVRGSVAPSCAGRRSDRCRRADRAGSRGGGRADICRGRGRCGNLPATAAGAAAAGTPHARSSSDLSST
jgi:serine/threonine-protein kinase